MNMEYIKFNTEQWEVIHRLDRLNNLLDGIRKKRNFSFQQLREYIASNSKINKIKDDIEDDLFRLKIKKKILNIGDF